jgi:hypothetical protein
MWPDQYGHPLSFDARIEELYTRVDPDSIDATMTIYDPKNYVAPWPYQVKTKTPTVRRLKRMASEDVNFYGWKGLFSGITEAMCAPMNEVNDFNKRIRDPSLATTFPTTKRKSHRFLPRTTMTNRHFPE